MDPFMSGILGELGRRLVKAIDTPCGGCGGQCMTSAGIWGCCGQSQCKQCQAQTIRTQTCSACGATDRKFTGS